MCAQHEQAALVLGSTSVREFRRSDSYLAPAFGTRTRARSTRPRTSVSVACNENVAVAATAVLNLGRRSPRASTRTCGASTFGSARLRRTSGPARAGGLQDITNVVGGPCLAPGSRKSQVPTKVRPPSATTSEHLPSRARVGEHSRPQGPTATLVPVQSQVQAAQVIPPPVAAAPQCLAKAAHGVPASAGADISVNAVHVESVQSATEYVPEIMSNLFLEEANFLPRPNYMTSQTEVNPKMRAILIDWLVEVHVKYRMRPETLFLAVNLIDRHLSRTTVTRKSLQLVGVVAMFIAAKFEEIRPPTVSECVYVTDSAYSKQEILNTECCMLTVLDFEVVTPTALNFIEYVAAVICIEPIQREVAQYILELGLLDYKLIRHLPSELGSAALLLSNELLERQPVWPALAVQKSRYSEQALRTCVEELRRLVEAAPNQQHQSVRQKFKQPKHRCVAKLSIFDSSSEKDTTK